MLTDSVGLFLLSWFLTVFDCFYNLRGSCEFQIGTTHTSDIVPDVTDRITSTAISRVMVHNGKPGNESVCLVYFHWWLTQCLGGWWADSCGRGCRPARRAIDQSEGQGGEGTTVTSPVLLQYQLFIIIFANFVYSDQLFSLRTSSKFAPTFTAALQNATESDLTFALLIPRRL